MLMVQCCSTAAGTALLMLCQLRGHVLFHVFNLGCMMLWNRTAAPMHFSGTFSACTCLSLLVQIIAWPLYGQLIKQKTQKGQHKEEEKKSQKPKPTKLQSAFKASTMSQEGRPLKYWGLELNSRRKWATGEDPEEGHKVDVESGPAV